MTPCRRARSDGARSLHWDSHSTLVHRSARRKMAGSLVPRDAFAGAPVAQRSDSEPPQRWEGVHAQNGAVGSSPATRYLAAFRRYKWIMAAVIVFGTALGVAYTR